MSLCLQGASASGLCGQLYSGVDLCVAPGECHCITGSTGAGKSTLLRTLGGLHSPGPTGQALLDGQPVAAALPGQIGLILQNPDTQLLCPDVGSEMAFGLENLRVPPAEMTERMLRAMGQVGLDLPLTRPVTALSIGQKYRLLLAAMLAMEPRVLLLDEPCAQLDPKGIAALNRILDGFLAQGGMVVLCEHEPASLSVICRSHHILDKTLRHGLTPQAGTFPAPPHLLPDAPVLVSACGTSLELEDEPVWKEINFSLRTGEIVLLHGANGVGKTTFLRCLTGFQKITSGSLNVFGHKPSPAALRGRVGFLIQNPARQLTADSVLAEVAFTFRQQGHSAQRCTRLAKEILEKMNLAHLANCPPFLLSHGEQHLVALASVLAVNPEILLLDDPFVGLDAISVARIWTILHRASENGTAVICVVHRRPLVHGAHSVHLLTREGLTPC